MDYLIFNKDKASEYKNLLKQYNLQLDIYYHPEFLLIDANIQRGEYEIFVVSEGADVFIYPYIKLPFYETDLADYFDISSPYGYAGSFCTSVALFEKAEELFLSYIEKNAVTEFVRYHYLYNENQQFGTRISNSKNRTIVTLDLTLQWNDIWMNQFSSTNRNLCRKMEKEGFQFRISKSKEDIDAFVVMYYETMKNANAGEFYFFENGIIQETIRLLGDNIFLAKIFKDEVNYGMALFFVTEPMATYYLSARNINFSKIPATNLILSKVCEYLKGTNVKLINFGGGLTDSEGDNLYKFKSNFSKARLPFLIGKRVHNADLYNELINSYTKKHGMEEFEKRKHLLQFYR